MRIPPTFLVSLILTVLPLSAFSYYEINYDQNAVDQIFNSIFDKSKFDTIEKRMLDQGNADILKMQQQLEMSQISGALSDLQSTQQRLSLVANPAYPAPNQSVTISLDDYSINSVGAVITWLLDDVIDHNFDNQRSIKITAPASGSTMTVAVTLQLPSGANISTSMVIKPIQIDIIVEAQTQVPVDYKGRSMPIQRTPITATALVFNGQSAAPATYSYRWSVDRQVVNGGPVRGQSRFTFTPPLRRLVPITVEVFDTAGAQIGQYSVEVPLIEPEIHFYEKNPLRGATNVALSKTAILTGSEMTLLAQPYYFSQNIPMSDLLYIWKVNETIISQTEQMNNEITIQSPGRTGSGVLELQVRNPQEILQIVTRKLRINY